MSSYGDMMESAFGEVGASDAPSPGSLLTNAANMPAAFPPTTVVKYYTANLANVESRMRLEHILTVSLRCCGVLSKEGDIVVINESGTFDKDGCYNVMIKYFEFEAAPDNA